MQLKKLLGVASWRIENTENFESISYIVFVAVDLGFFFFFGFVSEVYEALQLWRCA
jgi:hypothetical protein